MAVAFFVLDRISIKNETKTNLLYDGKRKFGGGTVVGSVSCL